jgi:folate-binding protein YgfZ
MNSEWLDFIASRQPVQAAPDCALCDLSHLGLIRASGPEAAGFLQGQLTNDTRLISPTRAQLTAWCSPKGRMMATFLAFQHGDHLYLQVAAERLQTVLKRLRLYVLRSRVELSDASASLARVGLAGDCATAILGDPLPGEPFAALPRGDLVVIRLPGDRPRFEILGSVPTLRAFWEQAERRAAPATPEFWSLLDIRAGVPSVVDETADAFVPQMANLQLIDGVSFTKGCYTGQEVVARMQYLGKLKRRMYYARIPVAEAPRPGTDLFVAGSESGQGSGKIVAAARSPQGGVEALVVVEVAGAEDGEVRLGGPEGPVLGFAPLPYLFSAGEQS